MIQNLRNDSEFWLSVLNVLGRVPFYFGSLRGLSLLQSSSLQLIAALLCR